MLRKALRAKSAGDAAVPLRLHHFVSPSNAFRNTRTKQALPAAVGSKVTVERTVVASPDPGLPPHTVAPGAQHTAPPEPASRTSAPQPQQQQQFKGYAELLMVTLLWGSYNPTLKMIYAEDHPLDPAALTAIRTVLSAAALAVAVMAKPQSPAPDATADASTSSSPTSAASELQQQLLPSSTATSQEDPAAASGSLRPPLDPSAPPQLPSSSFPAVSTPLLALTFGSVLAAGVELGLYNFAGTSLQAVGVQLTSATRAGFLQQFIVVLTPALSYLAGENIPPRVWLAVAIGLVGSVVVACDGLPTSNPFAAAGDEEMKGTLFMLASCLFYSMSVVRLSMYAPKFCSVDLTAVKKLTLGSASLIWLFTDIHERFQDLPLDTQLASVGITDHSLGSWLLVIYSGLGPGALATYLQTRGQASVPAVSAQVIFSLTPLWSAAMAYFLLGDDGMGPMSWLGGVAVVAAGLMAAQAQAQAHADTQLSKQSR